jgi:membrane protein YdbS with pleckstrin-like domain
MGRERSMKAPASIPFNPTVKAIACFWAAAIAVFAIDSAAAPGARVVVISVACMIAVFAFLLLLRGYAWKRHLLLNADSFNVPTGFLRLRMVLIPHAKIQRVWIARLPFTVFLCIRTTDTQVELPHFFLPDVETFNDLHQYCCDLATDYART